MPHVVITQTDYNLEIEVDGVPVLETGLDLQQGVVVELGELIELLEEASDEIVEFVHNDG